MEINRNQIIGEAINRIEYTLKNYSDMPETANVDYDVIRRTAERWYENKKDKILAIMNHPFYTESEPFKVVYPIDISRKLDLDVIDRFASHISVIEGDIWTSIMKNKSDFLYNVIEFMCHTFIEDRDINYYQELLTDFDYALKAKPHEGQKVSKFVRKLATELRYTFVKGEEYKAKEYTISEAEFAKYADALNPAVFASKCILSVDPVDYLLMSNGNSWSSCYCINSSWNGETYGGQFSCGTWSYMTDGVTMILYTVSKDVWDNYAEVPKVNRQLIMYDNAGYMTNSRLYPQSNDSTNAKAVYDSIRNCSQKMIAETFGLPNFWSKRNGTEFSISYDFAGYNDLSYFDDKIVSSENKTANEASYTDKETKKVVKIAAKKREKSVGGKALCPCCGDELDERYICNRCTEDEYVICEDCGSRINIRGGDCYLEYNGEYYCEDCYCICDRCREIVPARETQEVHSNHWETWCDNCANEEAFYCEYHECYEDESYYTEVSDIENSQGYLVTWCTEALEQDGGWYCEKCETWHTGDCKYHLDSNGNTICDDCWEGNEDEEA